MLSRIAAVILGKILQNLFSTFFILFVVTFRRTQLYSNWRTGANSDQPSPLYSPTLGAGQAPISVLFLYFSGIASLFPFSHQPAPKVHNLQDSHPPHRLQNRRNKFKNRCSSERDCRWKGNGKNKLFSASLKWTFSLSYVEQPVNRESIWCDFSQIEKWQILMCAS